MRPAWLLILLVVGCVGPEAPAATPPAEGAQQAPEDDAAPAPAPEVEERMPVTTERFVMLEDHSLGVPDGEVPAAKVPETLSPTVFYEGFVSGIQLSPWASFAFDSAWESSADIEVTLRFGADAPAASTLPKASGFPPVGAFLGTPERFAFFLLAQDAPDTLEPGQEYEVTMRATPPRGGFFARPGEQLAIFPYLSYATADGSPVSYVVGGPDPAGVLLIHQHFALAPTRAMPLFEESGELEPNPTPTGDGQQNPVDVAFQVPPEALYVAIEVDGAAKAGGRADLDVSVRTPSGEVVMGGSSPGARELVVLGPGNLQAYGRDLVAHVTSASSAAGATFTVRATAYVP